MRDADHAPAADAGYSECQTLIDGTCSSRLCRLKRHHVRQGRTAPRAERAFAGGTHKPARVETPSGAVAPIGSCPICFVERPQPTAPSPRRWSSNSVLPRSAVRSIPTSQSRSGRCAVAIGLSIDWLAGADVGFPLSCKDAEDCGDTPGPTDDVAAPGFWVHSAEGAWQNGG